MKEFFESVEDVEEFILSLKKQEGVQDFHYRKTSSSSFDFSFEFHGLKFKGTVEYSVVSVRIRLNVEYELVLGGRSQDSGE